ncbi:MAG: V-type ATP synthase subunit E [Thermoplasmatota archaeon]
MTAEKIIQKIRSDAQQKSKVIADDADKKVKEIQTQAKKEADEQAKQILSEGKIQAENAKKILLTKTEQESKRSVMNEKEDIISQCFSQAMAELSHLSEKKHKEIVSGFLKKGIAKLGTNCEVIVSKPYLKEVAKKQDLNVSGSINAIGGVVIRSGDGTSTLDYTFESIVKRKKASIRVEVGKLLFSK